MPKFVFLPTNWLHKLLPIKIKANAHGDVSKDMLTRLSLKVEKLSPQLKYCIVSPRSKYLCATYVEADTPKQIIFISLDRSSNNNKVFQSKHRLILFPVLTTMHVKHWLEKFKCVNEYKKKKNLNMDF